MKEKKKKIHSALSDLTQDEDNEIGLVEREGAKYNLCVFQTCVRSKEYFPR